MKIRGRSPGGFLCSVVADGEWVYVHWERGLWKMMSEEMRERYSERMVRLVEEMWEELNTDGDV